MIATIDEIAKRLDAKQTASGRPRMTIDSRLCPSVRATTQIAGTVVRYV
jgi:hypothetical protein